MNRTSLPLLALCSLMAASCIQKEQANTECDIESVSIHVDAPADVFYHDYDTMQSVISSVTDITFTTRSYAEVGWLPLTLRVTPGASVFLMGTNGEEPFLNGSPVDFSEGKTRKFRVVSEDKAWSRSYNITILRDKPSEGNLSIAFDDYALDPSGKYYVWNAPEVFTGGTWKNGNPGFKISKSSAKPMDYPSTPAIGEGPDGGDCLKLETRDTGPFGRMVNMRIASGSMFNGIFDVDNAIKNALKATQFGSPFTHKPVQFRVWLRTETGAVFQDRQGNTVAGVVDEPDAYVVLYRNEDAEGNKIQLDGSDVLSSPNIVGLGRLPHRYNADGSDQLTDTPIHGLTSEWQEVVIPVEYKAEVDPQILADKGYSLIIGFASSWQGAYFQGAVGSKLYIDKIRLFCE